MKQTAVEWLHEKLATSELEDMQTNINVWFQQAKQMEKEQMIKVAMYHRDSSVQIECIESYINKTFKSE